MQKHIENGELAGVITWVMRQGGPPSIRTYGEMDRETHRPMRPDTLFRIASLNKALTCLAALILLDERGIGVEEPAATYLPELAAMRVLARDAGDAADARLRTTEPLERAISIRDLMRHTAGFLYGIGNSPLDAQYAQAALTASNDNLQGFVSRVAELPLAFQPGTQWAYSCSIDVLGRLMEVVAGESLRDCVKKRVFDRLEMQDTDYFVPDDKLHRLTHHYEFKDGGLSLVESAQTSAFRRLPRAFSGGGGWGDRHGGVVSTAADYGRFLQMLLHRGELDGIRLFERTIVDRMIADQLGNITVRGFPVPGHGLGLGVVPDPADPSRTRRVFWSGSPYNTHFVVDYEQSLCGLLLTQTAPFRHLGLMDRFEQMVVCNSPTLIEGDAR